ncbi:MAG TPA: NTP transferase domain-containing protein, partial [Solirubrobacteraceae bacterium]|nr:NTP transferase domain-containing protein [Solirubrobacteraceae bacterium]
MNAPTVVILAAGQGTRMRSDTPKMLHELCGRPLVLWPVRAAQEAGAASVVVVDSPARALAPVLGEGVRLAVQERPDGTGGATAAAIAALGAELDDGAPVVVIAGDVPLLAAHTITELLDAHARAGAAATMATAILDDPSGYGRVVRDASGAVQRVVETKRDGDATAAERQIREVNTGIFVFAAGALRRALPRLHTGNAQGELYLPQVLDVLLADGQAVAAHVIDDHTQVLGINDRVALAQVRALAQAAIHRRHMLAGVTIVDPSCTVIDADVQIGRDTVIEPFTSIRGSTVIGRGCNVRHSYLIDCTLEDGAVVGPFGYLRPGALLRAGAKVGTFVEVKNSDIGAGAKVPHL